MAKSPRRQFADALAQECERTLRVLRAFPDDHSDLRLRERNRPARDVAWPLALGLQRLMVKALTTGFDWSQPPGRLAPALSDHVHHRGQLSVYLRAIGTVPSIYGPSGDQPWT